MTPKSRDFLAPPVTSLRRPTSSSALSSISTASSFCSSSGPQSPATSVTSLADEFDCESHSKDPPYVRSLDHLDHPHVALDQETPLIVIDNLRDENALGILDTFRHAIIQFLSFVLVIGLEDLSLALLDKIHYGNRNQDFVLHVHALRKFATELEPDSGGVDDLIAKVLSYQLEPHRDDHISRVQRHQDLLVFTCNMQRLTKDVLTDVYDHPSYGFCDIGARRKVIVEYSSPNIAKPFHVGHLRPTTIGAFISELYRRFNWEVNSMNYLGDWGTQFGLIAVGFKKYGSNDELERNPCHHLFDVYVKINRDMVHDPSIKAAAAEHFRKMEAGDEQALAVWLHWRELSVARYKEDYDLLNARFDTYTSEHGVRQESQAFTTALIEAKGMLVDDNGSKRIELRKYGLGQPVHTKGNGTSIYLSRDIAEAQQRWEDFYFDKMIYVVACQQDVHLARLFKTLELMGAEWSDRLVHINHGMVLGMHTRKGEVIFLDQQIRTLADAMLQKMRRNAKSFASIVDPKKVATELAVTALKVQDLSAKRIKNYMYTPTRADSGRGEYLQYTYARLSSIRRQNKHLLPLDVHHIDVSCLDGAAIHRLVFLLGTYPDVTRRTYDKHQPCTVVKFCFKLCRSVMRVYEETRVSGELDQNKARARLLLFECARQVLYSAMTLITLRPQERV